MGEDVEVEFERVLNGDRAAGDGRRLDRVISHLQTKLAASANGLLFKGQLRLYKDVMSYAVQR